MKLEVLPIPSGNDFRVTLSEEEQTRVAREIDESVRQSLNRGTKDLWVRLTEVVTHMVDKLNEPESRLHASLVTNVFDLVDLLPPLNVNQDKDLNRFAAEIKDRLCNFSAYDLKKNDILRVATATCRRIVAGLKDMPNTFWTAEQTTSSQRPECIYRTNDHAPIRAGESRSGA